MQVTQVAPSGGQGLTSTRYPTLPGFFFTTRTLPGFFLKISGFRVVSKYHFQCRIISMTLISRGKWPFTRLINFQNFPHPSDIKTFVAKWSIEFMQQLNTTIIIWRSAPTSPDILVLVIMMAITILGFVSGNKSLWTKVRNLTIHINGNRGVLLKL